MPARTHRSCFEISSLAARRPIIASSINLCSSAVTMGRWTHLLLVQLLSLTAHDSRQLLLLELDISASPKSLTFIMLMLASVTRMISSGGWNHSESWGGSASSSSKTLMFCRLQKVHVPERSES